MQKIFGIENCPPLRAKNALSTTWHYSSCLLVCGGILQIENIWIHEIGSNQQCYLYNEGFFPQKTELEDVLMYVYTSGTTGLPKAAIIRHRRVICFSTMVHLFCDMRSDEIIYCPLPLYHTAAGNQKNIIFIQTYLCMYVYAYIHHKDDLYFDILVFLNFPKCIVFFSEFFLKLYNALVYTVCVTINALGAYFFEAIKNIPKPTKDPSVLCTPLFEKSPIKSHRFCVPPPPFEKSPIKSHRFCVLPPLKNHPSKAIGFVYSPLWKVPHQSPSVLCTPPFEKSLFVVGAYFGVGVYSGKYVTLIYFLVLWNKRSRENDGKKHFSVFGLFVNFLKIYRFFKQCFFGEFSHAFFW